MESAPSKPNHVHFKSDKKLSFSKTAIDPRLIQCLKDMGIAKLFQMQGKILSHVLEASAKAQGGDVVLCAPTGSGKTLAYALPIVQNLLDRRMPKLRAVIVVPTRDLASQVYNVFTALAERFGISVAVAVGSSMFAVEAQQVASCEILICTPGRLVDHARNGEHLVLKHVRYLVVDESDRLLEESYHGWIEVVIPLLGTDVEALPGSGNKKQKSTPSGLLALAINPEVASRAGATLSGASREHVRKILVSATQTRNPTRLVALDVRNPTFFEPKTDSDGSGENAEVKYSVPSTMTERGWVVKEIQFKPMGLLRVLGWISADGMRNVGTANDDPDFAVTGTKLVFTNSVESAHRLCRLLELCAYALGREGDVLEMSGELTAKRRSTVLETVRHAQAARKGGKGRFLVVVCSDVLARGMDILNVDSVINYDAPIHINTYLHRAGRTARAGSSGLVGTLLLGKQVRHFRQMVHEADRGERKVLTKDLHLDVPIDSDAAENLSKSLNCLKRVLYREKLGLLSRGHPLPGFALYELCRERNEGHDNLENGNDEYLSKKRKRFHEEEGTNGGWHNFPQADAILTAEGEEVGDDNLGDLLFAEIGRNLLLTT